MKNSIKIVLFSIITLSLSGVYAQEPANGPINTSRSNIRTNREAGSGMASGKQTQGATFGERKGWDGTVKGGNIQILPSEGGLMIVFPDNIAFKVNEAEESITETKVKPSDLSRSSGTPIGGIIVKGGKNPGGQMKVIAPNASNGYDLSINWADGEYALTIAHEAAHTVQQSSSNAKSVIIKFIVKREQNNYEIVEQSIVNTTKSNTKD